MFRQALTLTTFIAAITLAQAASAATITTFGRPVDGIGSTTSSVPNAPSTEGDSNYNTATGSINFYIPLNGSICNNSTACLFGVTDVKPGSGVITAGTTADSGTGGWLRMILIFQGLNSPAATADLKLTFQDLDLVGANDPDGFFESVRFYDKNGNPISNLIDNLNDDNNGPIPFSVTGNNVQQVIEFPNITSLITSPFYLDLRFHSSANFYGTNTPEQLVACLTTTSAATPEPASMLLLGSSVLAGLGVRRKKIIG